VRVFFGGTRPQKCERETILVFLILREGKCERETIFHFLVVQGGDCVPLLVFALSTMAWKPIVMFSQSYLVSTTTRLQMNRREYIIVPTQASVAVVCTVYW
jgi:hypothetical protein